MSRSNRPKEKYGKSTELYLDNFKEGTAARTRPFSFDEIMLRRKNKKLYGDVKDGAGEEGNISRKDIVKNVSDCYESDKGYKHNEDSFPGAINHSSEDFVKVSSRKKDENTSMKEGNLGKVKDKESHNSEDKLKAKPNKGMTDKSKEGKINQRVHGRKKIDERSRRSSDDSESEPEKKFSRDSVGKDRYADRSRKSEKESKRKHRTGEDEKNRERNSMKKHDPGKRHESEFLDRKERRESPPSRYEESRPKRRRSRSRERDKDRDKRSSSLSPRAQKRTSHHGREHAELSSHSLKDRSGRQHSDADRNRISNNGSSSHFRRHGGSASGLGGYSPRKRRTEAAIKTPSPTNRSPEKKNAGWDLPPSRTDGMNAGSVLSSLQVLKPTVSSNADELPSAVPVAVPVTATTAKPPLPRIYSDAVSKNKNVSIDSIQLTQATRPMRRLYVENLPVSSSEKALMECLNNFLLSSGINHVQGTPPCISCIIHKEKGQALVEFLTPEDASAALSFDGISFSGSILKIRRPKDFVDMTGVQEKLVAAPDAISDIVKDSPHKIFIGGISRALSSDMLMEIAAAFGPLKAYRFQVNEDLGEPCAFLEYVDQSVTLKACAGLNGMKLGGQVLTVVQAIPNALAMENTGNLPFYGIPEHAKPLLERPTQVLKLKNVVNPDDLSSLSEAELEEILEDIRLECTRFGTVKSVNIVKYNNSHVSTLEAYEAADNTGSNLGCDGNSMKAETLGGGTDDGSSDISGIKPPTDVKDLKEVDEVVERNGISDDKSLTDLIKNELCEPSQIDSNTAVKEPGCPDGSDDIPRGLPDQLNNMKHEVELRNNKAADVIQEDIIIKNKLMTVEELKLEETNRKLLGTSAELDSSPGIKSDFTGKNDSEKGLCDLDDMFEVGCVLVEYGRTEASCMAAHCLHGRYFDDRVVVVGYVALDLYRMKFPR